MKLIYAILLLSFSQLAFAQRNLPLVISTTIGDTSHNYYSAKATVKKVERILKYGSQEYSVATVYIEGTIEGNLCLDNDVAIDIDTKKSWDQTRPYHYEKSTIRFVTFRKYFRNDRLIAGSTTAYGCTQQGIVQPFVAPLTFEASAGDDAKNAVFDVSLPQQYGKSYAFRVIYVAKNGKWKIQD